MSGRDRAMKGGIGTAAIAMSNGLRVAAIVAVNALGDVVDPATGAVLAGARNDDGSLADVRKLLRSGSTLQRTSVSENTTLAVVATNARLTKSDVSRVASMADDGIARAIVPAHTTADGDTVFAVATGAWSGDANVTTIGALAADVLARAIVRAATQATSVAGIPAARDLRRR
jgi:L-aminopeptidase/D-esterase-like protein